MEAELAHILVVDDDDRLRALLRIFLSENGYLVATAYNLVRMANLLAPVQEAPTALST